VPYAAHVPRLGGSCSTNQAARHRDETTQQRSSCRCAASRSSALLFIRLVSARQIPAKSFCRHLPMLSM